MSRASFLHALISFDSRNLWRLSSLLCAIPMDRTLLAECLRLALDLLESFDGNAAKAPSGRQTIRLLLQLSVCGYMRPAVADSSCRSSSSGQK